MDDEKEWDEGNEEVSVDEPEDDPYNDIVVRPQKHLLRETLKSIQ